LLVGGTWRPGRADVEVCEALYGRGRGVQVNEVGKLLFAGYVSEFGQKNGRYPRQGHARIIHRFRGAGRIGPSSKPFRVTGEARLCAADLVGLPIKIYKSRRHDFRGFTG